MSSPRRDRAAGTGGRPRAVTLAWQGAPLAGRLLPLVLDEARQRHDDALFSVTLGGMGRRQIDAVRFRPPGPVTLASLLARVRRLFHLSP